MPKQQVLNISNCSHHTYHRYTQVLFQGLFFHVQRDAGSWLPIPRLCTPGIVWTHNCQKESAHFMFRRYNLPNPVCPHLWVQNMPNVRAHNPQLVVHVELASGQVSG